LNSDFGNVVSLAAGATEVAQDNFGDSLVAYRPVSGGPNTVGVTAYVGSDSIQSGDWGRVIVNAGRWLISAPCGTPTPTPTGTPSPTPTPTCTAGWRIEPSMLNARSFASGATANGAFYVLTGFGGGTYVTQTERFNGA